MTHKNSRSVTNTGCCTTMDETFFCGEENCRVLYGMLSKPQYFFFSSKSHSKKKSKKESGVDRMEPKKLKKKVSKMTLSLSVLSHLIIFVIAELHLRRLPLKE